MVLSSNRAGFSTELEIVYSAAKGNNSMNVRAYVYSTSGSREYKTFKWTWCNK